MATEVVVTVKCLTEDATGLAAIDANQKLAQAGGVCPRRGASLRMSLNNLYGSLAADQEIGIALRNKVGRCKVCGLTEYNPQTSFSYAIPNSSGADDSLERLG